VLIHLKIAIETVLKNERMLHTDQISIKLWLLKIYVLALF